MGADLRKRRAAFSLVRDPGTPAAQAFFSLPELTMSDGLEINTGCAGPMEDHRSGPRQKGGVNV